MDSCSGRLDLGGGLHAYLRVTGLMLSRFILGCDIFCVVYEFNDGCISYAGNAIKIWGYCQHKY